MAGRSPKLHTLGQVPGQRTGFQASPSDPDMAVGAEQVKRGRRDPRAPEIQIIGRIIVHRVGEHKVAVIS